jgi:hypothetical protein
MEAAISIDDRTAGVHLHPLCIQRPSSNFLLLRASKYAFRVVFN